MKRQPLSGVEMLAAAVVVVLVTMLATTAAIRYYARDYVIYRDEALSDLRAKYGPDKFSRAEEEWIIRDFFQDRRGGIFIDVGANHYRNESNTYYLEASLGWSGIAVDPLEEFAADYKLHRPKTRFVAMFASDVEDSTVQFFVPANSLVASSQKSFTERHGGVGTPRQVPTTTLNAVLDQAGIAKLDLLSMDIELAEPKALAGFDVKRFRPEFVCIEGHPEVRQQIIDYFAHNHYAMVGKYLRSDSQNLYFRPLR